jgi:hypothetical protein
MYPLLKYWHEQYCIIGKFTNLGKLICALCPSVYLKVVQKLLRSFKTLVKESFTYTLRKQLVPEEKMGVLKLW